MGRGCHNGTGLSQWDGVATVFHKKYCKEIGLSDSVEACIQTIALKKTLESISIDYRRESEAEEGEREKGGEANARRGKCRLLGIELR